MGSRGGEKCHRPMNDSQSRLGRGKERRCAIVSNPGGDRGGDRDRFESRWPGNLDMARGMDRKGRSGRGIGDFGMRLEVEMREETGNFG